MELVSFAQDVLQSIVEHAASYKVGQIALRHLDRALWVVEKCARWAVPPPLDQDERPQPELVRPLPWVFFLMMLIALRVTRESISIINLIMGKPPLRSADVVMYIQSKRRYLRTLKYQGNRIARARSSSTQPRETWYSSVRSLFEFTMCFRKSSQHYGNNNTTNVSNNDEVLVVKCGKPERESTSPAVGLANVESTMERLIEKMMVDLDADSDEDSSFTITTITTPKSERSDSIVESDQDTGLNNEATPTKLAEPSEVKEIKSPAEENAVAGSTPDKKELNAEETSTDKPKTTQKEVDVTPQKVDNETKKIDDNVLSTKESPKKEVETPLKDTIVNSTPEKNINTQDDNVRTKRSDESPNKTSIPVKYNSDKNQICTAEENALTWEKVTETTSTKEDSINFLQHERSQPKSPRTPKNDQKMVNGRTVKSVPSKKKGGQTERREVNSAKSSPGTL